MGYGYGLKNGEDRRWLESLPRASIPGGDANHISSFYSKYRGDLLIPDSLVVDYIGTRMFIEWCEEMRSKHLLADTTKFDFDVFKKFMDDEIHYEFERGTIPLEERKNRGVYYDVRHRVLEAFTLNVIDFFSENRGIDGIPGNTRNLRCDLRSYLEKRDELVKKAA